MSRLRANLILMLAAMIWGSAFVAQQVGTGTLGTISFTGARFLLGGLVVLPFASMQFRRVHANEHRFVPNDWYLMILIGLTLGTAAMLQQHGILRTTVTNAGFLTALYVPMVPLIGLVLLRRRVHWVVWPASVGCFIGTYIMSGAADVELRIGDFWVIGSTLFWAAHVLMVGHAASRTRAPLVVATTQFLVCGVFGLTLGAIVEYPQLHDFTSALFGIGYVGVFSVGMAFTLQVVGQRYTQAADAAIILSSETVFAACAGYLFLGERLSLFQMSGAVLILVGIMAVELVPLTGIGRPRPLQ
ncbi:DMT family transporter [Desulfopila aestuarii]|uniref:Threonine/homoserine efflux transporter RhtA n=1 Tax=Desulfopila aestuarii DSM 18488 TaxID=1121416 RepID=A0A1M7Y9V2_9BACT|nr:DMT family transporter [Desulfopila aestuarii]SHO49361.1 Threonine/homoserine efflux transporter RhtA [Desulfopila aestuarii DSM 18488]